MEEVTGGSCRRRFKLLQLSRQHAIHRISKFQHFKFVHWLVASIFLSFVTRSECFSFFQKDAYRGVYLRHQEQMVHLHGMDKFRHNMITQVPKKHILFAKRNIESIERIDESDTAMNSSSEIRHEQSNITTRNTKEERDERVPFFASLELVENPPNSDSDESPLMDAERKEDRALTRRDAIRYGVMLAGASFLTGFTNNAVNVRTPQTPLPTTQNRPSFIPEPVLSAPTIADKRQPKQQTNQQPPSIKRIESFSDGPSATKPQSKSSTDSNTQTSPVPSTGQTSVNTGQIVPVNLTQVAKETNINVTMNCDKMCVSIDSSNFTFNKVEKPKVPSWLPSFLSPKPRVVKQYTNSELLIAATAAGSISEMGRTALLYPLSTVKTRLQADRNNAATESISDPVTTNSFFDEIRLLGSNVKRKLDDGDLYAGISPTLLVSVPATGIYYGVRDVTKRMLYMTPLDPTLVAVGGALVGDIVSLCFRTPSEALAIRLQAKNETTGDWLGDSVKRLPMVILTDIPYLISKILLNKSFIQGNLSISDYATYAVIASMIAGFLTTPFDVARTRILLNKNLVVSEDEEVPGLQEMLSDHTRTETVILHSSQPETQDAEDTHDSLVDPTTPDVAISRPDYSLVRTMVEITKEGNGGVRNLFSGWLERVLYLGIGRAWLEPIQLIEYIGVRDAVLLQWF